MKLAKTSVRRFKASFDNHVYSFFVPQRNYNKIFKEHSRRFARMVADQIGPDEERLHINVFVATEHPLDRPFIVIDRRDVDWCPSIYDYVCMEVDEGV